MASVLEAEPGISDTQVQLDLAGAVEVPQGAASSGAKLPTLLTMGKGSAPAPVLEKGPKGLRPVEHDVDADAEAEHKMKENRAAARKVSVASLFASVVAALFGFGIGIMDEELALIGFGMEASLDALSSALVLWRFKKPKARQHRNAAAAARFEAARDAKRERKSSIGIGATFIASSGILLSFAVLKLVAWDPNETSHVAEEQEGANWSIIVSFPAALIFGTLAWWKFKLAKALDSQVLRKDALCSALGAILGTIVVCAGLAEEIANNPAHMAAIDGLAGAAIAFILLLEGGRTLLHNLGSGTGVAQQLQ